MTDRANICLRAISSARRIVLNFVGACGEKFFYLKSRELFNYFTKYIPNPLPLFITTLSWLLCASICQNRVFVRDFTPMLLEHRTLTS